MWSVVQRIVTIAPRRQSSQFENYSLTGGSSLTTSALLSISVNKCATAFEVKGADFEVLGAYFEVLGANF